MNRFLITTADERSWRFDHPVLFLGDWCRLHRRKSGWAAMNAIVAAPYGLSSSQRENDLRTVHAAVDRLLPDLVVALNAFHHTKHSARYWKIVLGHWLLRYITVILNRYSQIGQALQTYAVSGTTIFDLPAYRLTTSDSLEFIHACDDDLWNHVLYARILEAVAPALTRERLTLPERALGGFIHSDRQVGNGPSKKHIVKEAILRILSNFARAHDAVIISSYLPRGQEARLQLSLGQCPQLWQTPEPGAFRADPEVRQRFQIAPTNADGFERFACNLLSEAIPACYLEGYAHLVKAADLLPWPTSPRFIFTSGRFDTDETFKVWTAGKVGRGTTYFVGQHGNNYGTLLGSPLWPETTTCDRFITWGWTHGEKRNVPAFIFKTAGQKKRRRKQDGGLLLVEVSVPHRIYTWDSDSEFTIYQEEQFRFVAALPEAIQERLTVRLHADHWGLRGNEPQWWLERCPRVRIDQGGARIQDLIAENRLTVHSYDSTGILESLALNNPMLGFWSGGFGHLLPSAKSDYEILRKAGILADTPEQAAAAVTARWDDVGAWWQSSLVQEARGIFCNRYARSVSRPIGTLTALLRDLEQVRSQIRR